jgi:NADH dehydrogenase (ubiquinone) 1 alpha subcomplex subunit 9
VVYNLVGRDYPTKYASFFGTLLCAKLANARCRNFSLADVHIEGTERIVEAVAKYDVDRYIHVSSHSASPESKSEFYATKVSAQPWLM